MFGVAVLQEERQAKYTFLKIPAWPLYSVRGR